MTHTISIQNRLKKLYPHTHEDVFKQIQAQLVAFKNKKEIAKKIELSEKDIFFITYADHVHEADAPTIQSLHIFLNQYVVGLCNYVHFLPFFPYSSDDGFSVIDYKAIKSEFGDWSDVRNVAADFKLMFDFVLNHISQHSEWFQQFLKGNPDYQNYFITYDEPVDTSLVFRPRTHPLLTKFKTAVGEKYVWTTFSEDQIDINMQSESVLLATLDVLFFYISQGARAIRLDAVGFLWKELGTTCIHLPQTHEVIKLFRDVLEEAAPDVLIITETNVPHKDNISYFGNGHDEAHMVYNFTLPPLLLYTHMKQDASVLNKWISELNYPSEETTFFNFTASHDGIGVTPLKGIIEQDEINELAAFVRQNGGEINYRAVAGLEPTPYELNITYLSAFSENSDAFLASQAVSLALKGVPAIYFNSLVGASNWREGVETLGYNRAINRQKFALDTLRKTLDDSTTKQSQIYSRYKTLIKLRQSEPLFAPHMQQEIVDFGPSVCAIKRTDGTDTLVCIVNMTQQTVSLDLVSAGLDGTTDIVSKKKMSPNHELGAYEVVWLK